MTKASVILQHLHLEDGWLIIAEKNSQRVSGEQREAEFRLPDRAVWSSPSETLHRHCETSRESQRLRADMTV